MTRKFIFNIINFKIYQALRKYAAALIIASLFFSSCKKDKVKEPDPFPTNKVTGSFHVSGKYYFDCNHNPLSNSIVRICYWTGDWVPYFNGVDANTTDNAGNFYFEYHLTDFDTSLNSLEIQCDSGIAMTQIPGGVNIDNLIVYSFPSTVVDLSLNLVDTPTVNTMQIGFDGSPLFINVSSPFHSGHLITYVSSMSAYSYSVPSNIRVQYNPHGSFNETALFQANLCDTTIAVLTIH